MQGGFHGRTFGAMALTTSKTVYRQGFAPLMPQVPMVSWLSACWSKAHAVRHCRTHDMATTIWQQSSTRRAGLRRSAGICGAVPQLPALQGAADCARRQRVVQGVDELLSLLERRAALRAEDQCASMLQALQTLLSQ